MRLTVRQRQLLELMRSGEDCIEERRGVWVGEEQTNVATLLFFLRHCLVSEIENPGGLRMYEINGWGERALVDESFDPAAELTRAARAAEGE
jgi:hypothetical protein